MSDEVKRLIAVLSQIEKCDICEDLVDWHVEFHSRRGDFVRVCRDCLAQALITSDAAEQSVHTDAANVCPECGEPFDFCAMGHYDVAKARRG